MRVAKQSQNKIKLSTSNRRYVTFILGVMIFFLAMCVLLIGYIVNRKENKADESSALSSAVDQVDESQPLEEDVRSSEVATAAPVEVFSAGTMFIGDSITKGMLLYPDTTGDVTVVAENGINTKTILEKGIYDAGGEKITAVQAAAAAQPSRIYIMLGSNGIAFLDAGYMVEHYGTLIDQLKAAVPGAKIYIESIPPVTKGKEEADPRYANAKINDYNEQLKVLAGEKGVGYIDVHAALQNADGVLDAEASPKDGMHFGRSTYEKWFAYLRSETGAQEANG